MLNKKPSFFFLPRTKKNLTNNKWNTFFNNINKYSWSFDSGEGTQYYIMFCCFFFSIIFLLLFMFSSSCMVNINNVFYLFRLIVKNSILNFLSKTVDIKFELFLKLYTRKCIFIYNSQKCIFDFVDRSNIYVNVKVNLFRFSQYVLYVFDDI